MTPLHYAALGIGYLVLFLIAAWGLFIAVVGAVHIIGSWLSEAPAGTRYVPSRDGTDASAPAEGVVASQPAPSAPLFTADCIFTESGVIKW